MEEDTHKGTDVPIHKYDTIRLADADDPRIDSTNYARVISKLIHAMVYTRPDIAFSLGKLYQFMSDPAEYHGHGMKTLLRYMRSTVNRKIKYGGELPPSLTGFSDADYAADKTDRKSTLRQVFMFAGGPVSWASKKQRLVATLTTDVEYIALSEYSR